MPDTIDAMGGRVRKMHGIRMALSRKALFAAVAAAALVVPLPAQAGGTVELDFDPANFPDPLAIDNPYHPLVVGHVYTYEAEGEDGCEVSIVTVTDQTKDVAAGVTTRVVNDRGYEDEDCDGATDDELVERTDDWYAQDVDGNIWYLGEFSEDCEGEDDCEVSDGSWEAGVDEAVAGIIMLAHPAPGLQYYQEFYEDFAEDEAKVLRTDVWVSLYESDLFDHDLHHCIVTKEWTALSPGEVENKFYCPEIGLVKVKELMGRTLTFELVDRTPEP